MQTIEHLVSRPTGDPKPRPVLLLPGAWHGAWCYDLWRDDFAAHGYETHAISWPGQGQSSRCKPLHRYSLEDYVNIVADIIEQITPSPFVVGHSMGGFVLQRYLQHRQLPGAVLLASVPRRGILPMCWRLLLGQPLGFLSGVITGQNHHWFETPELVARYLLTGEGTPQYSPEAVCARLVNESMRVGVRLLLGLGGDPRQVMTPLLIVAGEYDALFTVSEQQRMALAYGAEFRLIKRQGHDLMLERDWQQVAQMIRDWLDRLKPWLEDR